MASTSKLILRIIKVGGNNREFAVHRDKQEPDKRFKCSHCSKMFGSLKSLCGHMRCHPDRRYRGMRPPDAFQFAVEADRVGLVRHLPPGWGRVKAKRSSKAAKDLMDAAYNLMLLSTGDHRYRYLDDYELQLSSHPRKRKRQQKSGETASITTASELSRYICKTCDKAFPSGQALGGHMRLHWVGPSHPPLSLTTYLPGQGQGQPAMVTSDVAEATRPVLDFDLNQLPLLPDDDDATTTGMIINQ